MKSGNYVLSSVYKCESPESFLKIAHTKLRYDTSMPNRRAHIHTDLHQDCKPYTIKQINKFSMNTADKVVCF